MKRIAPFLLAALALTSARQARAVSTAYMNYSGDRRYDNPANWNQLPGVGYISAWCNFNGSTNANVPVNPASMTLGYGGSTSSIRGNGELHVQSGTLTLGSALTLGYSKSVANSGRLYVEGGTIVTPGINNDSQNGTSTANWVYVTSGTLDLKPASSAVNGSINPFVNCSFTGGTIQNLESATARALSGTAAFSNLTGTLTVNPSAAATYTSDPLLSDAACGITGSGTVVKDGATMLTFSPGGLNFFSTMNLASGLTVKTPSVTFLFGLDSPGPSGVGDRIRFAGSGGLTLQATANVDLVGTLPTTAGNYRLFDLGAAAAPDMSRLNLVTTTGPGGVRYSLSSVAEPGFVNLVVAPSVWVWYGDGFTPGGDGTWSDTGSTWNNGGGVAPLEAGAQAVFDSPSGEVTVDQAGVTPGAGMRFAAGTTYALAGGAVTLGGGTSTANTINVQSAATATISAPLAGVAGLNKAGTGELVLSGSGTLAGNVLVSEGTVRLSHASPLGTASVFVSGGTLATAVDATIAATRVDFGGRLTLDSTETHALDVASLTIDRANGGALVDVGVGRIEIAGGADATALKSELVAGRGGNGDWTGTEGILSSVAATSSGTRTVGYRVAGDTSAVVAFAAPGDTDLDGVVNTIDLVSISAGGKYGTGAAAVWSEGDFNYDGVVNSLDLVAIASSGVWGTGNYLPLPTTPNPVPEPATLGLLAAATIAGLAARLSRTARTAP